MRRIGLAAATAFGTVGLLGSAVAPVSAARWSSFGAPLAVWQRAHPADAHCAVGTCWGPRVHSSAQPFEFDDVTTERGRVDGYDQALPDGTSQAEAALSALTQLPSDTEAGSITLHHDRFGQSCAYVNFSSKTLEAWFGQKGLGGDGTIGVELATVTVQGTLTYNPANVNVLLVAPVYRGSGDNC